MKKKTWEGIASTYYSIEGGEDYEEGIIKGRTREISLIDMFIELFAEDWKTHWENKKKVRITIEEIT